MTQGPISRATAKTFSTPCDGGAALTGRGDLPAGTHVAESLASRPR